MRALLSLFVLVLIYVVALAIAGVLFVLAYLAFAGVEQGDFIIFHPKAGVLCLLAGLGVLATLVPSRRLLRSPGPLAQKPADARLLAELDAVAGDLGVTAPAEVYLSCDTTLGCVD